MEQNKIQIPDHISQIIDTLTECGFEAYIVGGCVRDSLLNKIPYDYDIATSAQPLQIINSCKKFKTINTGIKHGTVTVINQNKPVEVTTFRIDGNYKDHRHPDKVQFCRNLSEDLSRRDFTINSLAYNGKIIDVYNGISDLNNKIIRCVGNPDKRFNEDALRILRALRFASVLDFQIEKDTKKSIFKNKKLLSNISQERITKEFLKMMCGKGIKRILMEYSEIIFEIIPELKAEKDCIQNNPYHAYDVYEHSVISVEKIIPCEAERMTMLLHDIGKPLCRTTDKNGIDHFYKHAVVGKKIARNICLRMKLPNTLSYKIQTGVYFHDMPFSDNQIKMKYQIKNLGIEMYFFVLKLKFADSQAKTKKCLKYLTQLSNIENSAKNLINDNVCLSLKQLDINGNDLIKIGVKKGTKIGEALDELLCDVIENKCLNVKNELIKYFLRSKQLK